MTRLIDKKDVLEAVKALPAELDAEAVQRCIEIVSNQPEVDAIPQWILCSERLPSGQEEVIVSCHDDSGDTSYDYTTCGWVTNDGEYWIADNEINSHVVAWMPLPTPYERKEE